MAQTNANLIWKIADELRGPYQPNQYGDVILSFTVLRRPTPGPPTPSKHPSVAGRTACTGARRASNRLTTTQIKGVTVKLDRPAATPGVPTDDTAD
jgi:hypothetical protein